MEWKENLSGMGWSYWQAGDYLIEPEDLDADHWVLWIDLPPAVSKLHEGTLVACKTYAEENTREVA